MLGFPYDVMVIIRMALWKYKNSTKSDKAIDFLQIYVHSAFETMNIAKLKYYGKWEGGAIGYDGSASETVADNNFQE